MPREDWRSPGAYAFADRLAPEGLAWEFLRRNPEYRTDASAAAAIEGSSPDDPAARWGLRFPGRSGRPRGRRGRLLAT